MLQIKNLTITHKKDLRPLLEDFNFTLNTGDRAVIISEEGNGKSTLLKLIYDASLVSDYVEYTGQILTQGTLLGYLPQEFPDAWKKETIYSYCVGTPAFTDLSPKELAAIASQLMLPADFFYSDQLCGTLSGGEKVKLQIAALQMAVLISIFWTSLQTILILKRWNGWSISSTAAENRCFLSPTMRL